jgi:hypothetical protein
LFGALRGREAEAVELIERCTQEAIERGEEKALSLSQWATASLYSGLGRYEDALAAANLSPPIPRSPYSATGG